MFKLLKSKINEYSKKYQIDLPYVIRNEFWVYLRLGITTVTGLATSVVFARLATREVFGQYNYLIAILSIIALTSIPGLKGSVLRSTARGNDGNYQQATKTRFLWSFIGIPALLGIGVYYYYYNIQIIGICLMISGIFFPFLYAPNSWESFFAGKKKFNLTALFGSVQSTISAAAIIIILFISANHLVLIFSTYLVTNAFLLLMLYRKSLKYTENSKIDGECIRYGYFLTTNNIAGTIAQHVDKILIGTLLGAPQLAIYTIATAIPVKTRDLLRTAWYPFRPKISEQGTNIKEITTKVRRLVCL